MVKNTTQCNGTQFNRWEITLILSFMATFRYVLFWIVSSILIPVWCCQHEYSIFTPHLIITKSCDCFASDKKYPDIPVYHPPPHYTFSVHRHYTRHHHNKQTDSIRSGPITGLLRGGTLHGAAFIIAHHSQQLSEASLGCCWICDWQYWVGISIFLDILKML